MKSQIALRGMRRVLQDNGYDNVQSDRAIVESWDRFKNEKPNEYAYERNNVYNDTLIAGDMSRQAQASFLG